MPETTTLDDALERLADLLAGATDTKPAQPSEPKPDPKEPTAPAAAAAASELSAELARQVMFLMSVPIITPGRRAQLERELPLLVEALARAKYRPTLLSAMVDATDQTQRSAVGEGDVLASTVKAMQEDLGASGERVAPAIALGLFMAGYTIVKQWGD